MNLKIITSVAPYVTIANAQGAVELAYSDGFSGVELNEDHLHLSVESKPNCLDFIKQFSSNKHMKNSVHKSLLRPSIDSENTDERNSAVNYTFRTLDYMQIAGISRLILHSFSDLPSFFKPRSDSVNPVGYFIGCNVVKLYGLLAPTLKAYRESKREILQKNFINSLSKIARYASDIKIQGKSIEIIFEEHYSDSIDYNSIQYGKGNFFNVIRGIDTAHQLIRTKANTDLHNIDEPIHFHAVDTNGILDDHRTIGTGKVEFTGCLKNIISRNLTDTIVLEDSTRHSVLKSKERMNYLITETNRI